MKQKLTTLSLALLAGLTAWAHDFEQDGIFYKITSSDDKTVSVSFKGDAYYDYNDEYSGEIVIPSTVSHDNVTYSVTAVDQNAFYWCKGVTSVTISRGVSTIEDNAFEYCSVLETVTIPGSVTSIGRMAFNGCESLGSLVIPNSVKSIGASAFNGCSALKTITIPSSVDQIDAGTFSYCSGLESITVDRDNSKYDSRDNCNAIIETESNTLVSGCNTTVIPSSVTAIGASAFAGCNGLEAITIHGRIKSIDNSAFADCTGIRSVTIPRNVTTIGAAVFSGCNALEKISVDKDNSNYDSRNSNAIIEKSTNTLIAGCKTTVIPNSVKVIGTSAFSGCSELTFINIPHGVTTIESWAFAYCSKLAYVTLPQSVTNVNSYAFASDEKLTAIRFLSTSPCQIGIGGSYVGVNRTFANSPKIQAFYIPQGTMDTYVEAWGSEYACEWGIGTKPINYYESEPLPVVDNTEGGYAMVFESTPNGTVLGVRLDNGYSIDEILVNGQTIYAGNMQLGQHFVNIEQDGTLVISGIRATDIIKMVYAKPSVPTAVGDIQARPAVEGIYNLRGQKLSAPQRGVNIINGKKVVVF